MLPLLGARFTATDSCVHKDQVQAGHDFREPRQREEGIVIIIWSVAPRCHYPFGPPKAPHQLLVLLHYLRHMLAVPRPYRPSYHEQCGGGRGRQGPRWQP
jgi:hypothetical protein